MTSLTLLRSGLMMTVQDGGRAGLLRYGVSGSGPIDPEAMGIANALVGNAPDAAALEFAYHGGTLKLSGKLSAELPGDRLIAVCAAATSLRIDGEPAAPWRSHRLRNGQEVSIGATPGSVWGYVAISGGIATPLVLGARSTHLRSGLGGLDGRALQDGDQLPLGPNQGDGRPRALQSPWRARTGAIRVVPGPQDDYFSDATISLFRRQPFRVTNRRDRMAMVLDGPSLPAARGHDIVSDGTLAGSVQVPGSGQPMVLLADRQTTGGYPKIGTVISVDLPRLAQMPVGQAFRFQAIAQDRAEDVLIRASGAYQDALSQIAAQEGAQQGAR